MQVEKYLLSIPEMKQHLEEIEDPLLKLIMNHILESNEELAKIVKEDLKKLDKRIESVEES